MIQIKTVRWQCSGCDHLCAMLTDEIIKPAEIIRCPRDDEWRTENPKAQLSKVRDIPDREGDLHLLLLELAQGEGLKVPWLYGGNSRKIVAQISALFEGVRNEREGLEEVFEVV